MKKKVIALIAVAALSVSALTGCGSNETAAQTSEAAATTANQETAAQTTEATESKEVADTDTTIKVAASTSCRDPGGSKASVSGAGLYSGDSDF